MGAWRGRVSGCCGRWLFVCGVLLVFCIHAWAGDVYSFGYNEFGQLGHGDTRGRVSPTKIATLSDVVAVAASGYHSLILLGNGDVYSFGSNWFAGVGGGQLGHGDTSQRATPTKIATLSNALAVSAGGLHSLVVLANGDLYSFGGNRSGQLGHGDTMHRYTPTKIAALSREVTVAAGLYHSLVIARALALACPLASYHR